MKKLIAYTAIILCIVSLCFIAVQQFSTPQGLLGKEEEIDKYDGPGEIAWDEFQKTKDPALGYVPTERLVAALEYAKQFRVPGASLSSLPWTERGPRTDTAGPSGNSRPNGDHTAGRTRAILVDLSDPTGNTVWMGSVSGGLWKTTSINTNPANWTLVNDYLSNLAITDICQNPVNNQIMYFCTGEGYFNFDAVRGAGVWKSTNGGTTWTQLASTTSFLYGTNILCDAAGNVYLGTRGSGLRRSTDGGTTWIDITPTGFGSDVADLKLSTTGRLHITMGLFGTANYAFTASPATVASGTWTSPTTPFPLTSLERIELACSGNTLLALPSNASTSDVATLYRSTDGGNTWAATGTTPVFSSGQGWYCMAAAIDSSNTNTMIVGSLDAYKTTDGGANWTKISTWASFSGQYVHADHHAIIIYKRGAENRVLFGTDGGVHYSADGGTTIRDRNRGLGIKQFFSVAIHPTTTNYFLAGAQDNGSHRLRNAGLGGSVEVTGGDGAFVHIDQNEPQYQFTAYVRNQYRRSTDGGNTWTSVNLSSTTGQFINPTDYDDINNIMYCGNSAGTYRRWLNPQSGATNEVVTLSNITGSVTAVMVSPYTSHTVLFGTNNGVVYRVPNANTFVSGSAATLINTGLSTGVVSCVNLGTTDNNIIVSSSSYGVNQVWISTNGGTSWTNVDGNLPDMPVRWCMYAPGNNQKAILATDAGVWTTSLLNGGSTVWVADPLFPAVRTNMLQYRASDNLIAAATHGRGIWTQSLPILLPSLKVTLQGQWKGNDQVQLNWKYDDPNPNVSFEIEAAPEGGTYSRIGSAAYNGANYTFQYKPTAARMFYRIKVMGNNGSVQYSNLILLKQSGRSNLFELVNLYPNPVVSNLQLEFRLPASGVLTLDVTGTDGRQFLHKEEMMHAAGYYSKNYDMHTLPPGTYFLTLRQNGILQFRSFVKK
jgi:trimeric autotransporter adhesin